MYLHKDEMIIDIKKNGIVFRDFHKIQYVYCVLEGVVKVFKYTEDGNEKIVDILTDNDYLAVTLMFGDDTEYNLSCIALSDVKLVKVTVEQMYEALQDKNVLKNYINFTSRKLMNFKNYLANTSEIEERILIALNELYERFGKCIGKNKFVDLPFSKTDLASFIGLRRETLSRKLTSLSNEGKIKVEKNRIYLKI
ncbi:Crp/Fnr family transcriptional regulator [Mycoplasmatota bacterium zrk1]